MNPIRMRSRIAISAMAMTMVSSLYAGDARYPVKTIQKIDIISPSESSSWASKNWLDCDDVVLTEEDVRYALQHIRRISRKAFFSEDRERTGCAGSASVRFQNGKLIVIGVEPTGFINIFEATETLKPKSISESFYDCPPCNKRKMDLLQDALDRATERRLKELKRQGRLPP
ncbi:hypothetical protein [Delftia acidovorans]|uniref:hypothetical protein n=1 Tax=Delftia acidovorans TaxID=80866 RepID=UPI00242B3F9F|nr:hypothetical protein [Delftia acidovorans]